MGPIGFDELTDLDVGIAFDQFLTALGSYFSILNVGFTLLPDVQDLRTTTSSFSSKCL